MSSLDKGGGFYYHRGCSWAVSISCDVGMSSLLEHLFFIFLVTNMRNLSVIMQGNHPKDGQPVILKLSKVGFTVRHRRTMASVPKVIIVSNILFCCLVIPINFHSLFAWVAFLVLIKSSILWRSNKSGEEVSELSITLSRLGL